MKCVEKEEERIAIEEPTKMTYHLCIVNLVIGTLYCSMPQGRNCLEKVTNLNRKPLIVQDK